jgi:hypothetical protein
MKRPSVTVIAVVGGIALFFITEVIVWWPDPPKKKSDDPAPQEPPPTAQAAVVEPPPPSPAPTPNAAPARPGLDIPQLQADESDEIRRLEGCSDKHCGDPCIVRCDPQQDGRCATGKRPGACTVSGECSTTLPAVCPAEGTGEPSP